MKIDLVDVKAQYAPLIPELKQAFAGALDSGRFIFGPEVEGFEREASDRFQIIRVASDAYNQGREHQRHQDAFDHP